jgi:hypothetical protein
MGSVPLAQAGVASAVNDTIREVGGALGVAVVGSLVGALYAHQLAPQLAAHHAPAAVNQAATGSVAAADVVGGRIGGTVGNQLVDAAHQAFVTGMAGGMRVAAGVAVAGALGAFVALPRCRPSCPVNWWPESAGPARARPLGRRIAGRERLLIGLLDHPVRVLVGRRVLCRLAGRCWLSLHLGHPRGSSPQRPRAWPPGS